MKKKKSKEPQLVPLFEQDIALVRNANGGKDEMPAADLDPKQLDGLYEFSIGGINSMWRAYGNYEGVMDMCEREYLRRGISIPEIETKQMIEPAKRNRFANVKTNLLALSPEQLEEIAKLCQKQLIEAAQDF